MALSPELQRELNGCHCRRAWLQLAKLGQGIYKSNTSPKFWILVVRILVSCSERNLNIQLTDNTYSSDLLWSTISSQQDIKFGLSQVKRRPVSELYSCFICRLYTLQPATERGVAKQHHNHLLGEKETKSQSRIFWFMEIMQSWSSWINVLQSLNDYLRSFLFGWKQNQTKTNKHKQTNINAQKKPKNITHTHKKRKPKPAPPDNTYYHKTIATQCKYLYETRQDKCYPAIKW